MLVNPNPFRLPVHNIKFEPLSCLDWYGVSCVLMLLAEEEDVDEEQNLFCTELKKTVKVITALGFFTRHFSISVIRRGNQIYNSESLGM